MSLGIALNTATNSLQLTQRAIDVVSRNVANANTRGYTEKSLPTSPIYVNGEARGARAEALERRVDQALWSQLNIQSGTAARQEVKAQVLERLDLALGRVGDGTTLGERFSQLGDALVSLQATPESTALQQTVVVRAQSVAMNTNNLAREINTLRQDSERAIAAEVDEVNDRVARVHALNVQISRLSAGGQGPVDLEDERDRLVTEIATYADIQTFKTADNRLYINMGNGRALLDTEARRLSFKAQQVGPAFDYTNPTPSPAVAPNLAGLTLDGRDITLELDGGRLKGHFELRDQILPQAQAQLDEFAGVMATAFQSQGLNLFSDGNLPPPVVYPGNRVGLSARLQVNQAVIDEPWRVRDGTAAAAPSPNAGNLTIIQNLLNTVIDGTQTFATTGLGPNGTINSSLFAQTSIKDYAINLTSFQATQIADITEDSQFQQTLTVSLETQYTNRVAVNSDEQMTDLIALEASYGANARIIQTVQRLFDELLQSV